MPKPTRLRPSQGGRFREVRPSPELVAQIRATEDQPRGALSDADYAEWSANMLRLAEYAESRFDMPPKAPALPYFKAIAGPASTMTFPETERAAFDWFCAQEWPRSGYR